MAENEARRTVTPSFSSAETFVTLVFNGRVMRNQYDGITLNRGHGRRRIGPRIDHLSHGFALSAQHQSFTSINRCVPL